MKNQSLILSALGLIALIVLAGCSTTSTVITGETREPTDPETIKIYRIAPDNFEEIGIVEANSKNSMEFSEQGKTDVAIERLKEEAAELGANGILLTGITDGYGGSFSIGVGTGSYSRSSSTSVGAGTSTNATYKIAGGIAIWVTPEVTGE